MADDDQFSELAVFSTEAHYALVAYQMIEEQLKRYISTAHDIVRLCLSNRIPYKYSEKEIDGYALERLIAIFGKLNDNEDLIRKLNKLPKDRNYCAHKAYAEAYFKRVLDKQGLDNDVTKIKDMGKFAWECFQNHKDEIGQVETAKEKLSKDI